MNFKIKCHIYPYTVHVFYEQTVQESKVKFEEYYKTDIDDEWNNPDAITVFEQGLKGYNKVAILLGKENGMLLSRIHHEVIHATTYILNKLGIEVSYQNDESITYLSTYLFEKIINKLKLNAKSNT